MMLSALDLARRIAAGEITPREVLDRCAETIGAREAEIGAFAALDIGAARRATETPGLAALPLAGLPVGIKDIFDTADLATAHGSPIYAGNRPPADAAMVALVRRAGGVVIGKTATAEFASRSAVPTRNPRDVAHTPGGSSCGSAAAVAAGMVPLAFGSQTGGSIIRPAAFCGIAGFKPSYGLLPTPGMKCVSWSLDTVGLFAAGIADVAFAAALVSGRDLRVDGRPLPVPAVAIARTALWGEASADMQAAVEQAARAAETAGATVKELVLPPIFEQAMTAHQIIAAYEASRSLAFEHDHHHDRLGAIVREQLDEGAAISADTYDDARRTASRARQLFLDVLTDGTVILTPSATGAAPRGNESGAAAFNRLWSLLGTPCVNVPGMTGRDGLPLGLQIVARFGRDRFALLAAAFLEQALARCGNRAFETPQAER
jgi:Asp-tRNA(Asn)/Glu-tRNA(Gln) amidotransferase A subunit family amidase